MKCVCEKLARFLGGGVRADGQVDRIAHDGQVKSFAKHPIRHKMWKTVSPLNAMHMRFAWISLFGVALCDLYVRLVASGTIHDAGFHF